MKNIVKYFLIASIIPVLYTFISGEIILFFDDTQQVSEWFPDNYSFELFVFTVVSFIISLSTLPILLNADENWAKNNIVSFLTWFLFPVSILIIFIYPRNGGETKIIAQYHSLSICLVHLAMLIFSYILFRKKLKYNKETLNPDKLEKL